MSDGQHAEIIPLGDRSPQAPSVVYKAPDGSFRYGETAERHAAAEPERIAREFKRRIGDQTPVFVAGSPMSAHALSKALLGWTIEQAVAGQDGPPDRVTVTCPANWGPYRRELMDQVTALNADYPISVCTEPEAAAVHFASTRRIAEGQAIAVYDLGGGTFDAAVLRRTSGGGFEVLGTPDGLEQLGGVDFDDAVFERVCRSVEWDRIDQDDPDTLAGLARLRRDCTEAKEALSSETETTVSILLGSRLSRVRLTRAEFEELITPLVTDTVEILDKVIRRAGLAPADLAAIVLVGGSSRVPLISELITRRFGRPAVLSAQPKLCVAMGAALLGGRAGAGAVGSPAASATVVTGPAAPSTGSATPSSTATASSPTGPAPTASAPSDPTPTPQPADGASGDAALPDGATTILRPVHSASPTGQESPAPTRVRRGIPVYPLISAACAVIALVVMLFGPAVAGTGQTWDSAFRVDAGGQPPASTLTVTMFGISVTRPAVAVTDGHFDLRGSRMFLSGPVRGTIDIGGTTAGASAGTRAVVLSAADRWGSSRWLSIPFGALVLTALFSFAYAESTLRPIRRRRGRPAAGELMALIGSGFVAGIAAVLAMWVVGDRLPTAGSAITVIVAVCAGVGLLAFAWPARASAGGR